MKERNREKPEKREKSVFTDFETIALVMHIEAAKISDLRDALESIDGLRIIYQRKKESGKLYISEAPPEGLRNEESEEGR